MVKFVLALIVVASCGGYWFFSFGPAAHVPIGVLMNPDTRLLGTLARKFMEDIKFKDFKAAAEYSLPEQREKADIPALIERLFQVKPEFLQIDNIELVAADLDSTGDRARTKLKTDVKLLNSSELKHPEVLLYWKKDEKGKWMMDLASSLQ
jgi:hypothetical protein